MSTSPSTYLTPAEVATMLRVKPATISRWSLEDPTMPVTRLPGRVVRYEAEALGRWLRARARGRAHGGRKGAVDASQVADSLGAGVSERLIVDQRFPL
jgi:excisionase family DNA binding protein